MFPVGLRGLPCLGFLWLSERGPACLPFLIRAEMTGRIGTWMFGGMS